MAIDEELTPNLYKLYNEGFQFTNFYTPLFPVSTADGEYIADTSLIPKEGVWSIYRIKGNYMPYSYANVFENLGYTSKAYHNNSYNYYNRDVYLETMGYDSYLACKNGLEKRINCKIWPQSDYQMVNTTIDDYINDEHFITYYMTVSGHLEYSKIGNMMVSWNWDKVKYLPLSNAAKSYLACNIEFDKAIGELINRLEQAGKLDNTVIAISGDHYPYGLTLEQVNELSDYQKDENFELHHMSFLLWNSEMENPIKIDGRYNVNAVVLGLDTELTYEKLQTACNLLQDSNLMYIGANPDLVFPVENGIFYPDCGSIAKMLFYSVKRFPKFLGKPHHEILDYCLEKKGVSKDETVIIGDRLYTDIACGQENGCDTILIFSGEARKEDLINSEYQPTLFLDSIKELKIK